LGEGSEFSDLERKIDLVLDGIQDQRRQQQDMMRVVDRATVEFIKEFSPEMLEDIIGESKAYSFGKHWRSYKKFYQKRSDSGYFVRQYRAILLECLQQK
jgi:predicted component of type VI protein secretion system